MSDAGSSFQALSALKRNVGEFSGSRSRCRVTGFLSLLPDWHVAGDFPGRPWQARGPLCVCSRLVLGADFSPSPLSLSLFLFLF